MKYRLTLLSPWAGAGTMEDSYRPQFGDDYTYLSWQELSVRPGPEYMADPNLGTMLCDIADFHRVTLADGTSVLCSEEDRFRFNTPGIVSDVVELTAAAILATLEADTDYHILSCEEVTTNALP